MSCMDFREVHRFWIYHLIVLLFMVSFTIGCAGTDDVTDSDNDGIIDTYDHCPGTTSGETVDEDGCAEGQLDTDGDGITDDLDLCEETPSGEIADVDGCSDSQLDEDEDGVSDADDQCPSTLEGKEVDDEGCADHQKDTDEDGVNDEIDLCPFSSSDFSVNYIGCNLSDIDEDGVKNTIDLCLGTPWYDSRDTDGSFLQDEDGNTIIDENGCVASQLDTDGDGVTDDLDLCEETPSGEIADVDGCPINQPDPVISAGIYFEDADQYNTTTFDMVQDQCKPSAIGDVQNMETSTDVLAYITISVPEGLPGMTLNGYTIEYMPQMSADGSGNMVMPPTLNSITAPSSVMLTFPPSSTTSFTIMCFSIDQKEEYRALIGWTSTYSEGDSDSDGVDDAYTYTWSIAPGTVFSELFVSRYTVRIILHCIDDNGDESTVEVLKTVSFGNYDNC